jgi:putative DNA methylase
MRLFDSVSSHESPISDQVRRKMTRGSAAKLRSDGKANQLGLAFPSAIVRALPSVQGPRAIEDDAFPFEILSHIAESESWRKEVNRPLSHIHKWWAQRLGSVFRAVVIGALAPKGTDIMELFYSRARFPEATIFDPFMGSGTTIVEALKLGARAIGRDINPVAYFLVRNAVARHSRAGVIAEFKSIESDVRERLQSFYKAKLPDGSLVTVLYYFWVKQVDCPSCELPVDLFSSRVFARHAYAKKFPEARSTCPHCGVVNAVRFDATEATCCDCKKGFNPSIGPARGQKACCPACAHEFGIVKTIRGKENPPAHRLYAKLVLHSDGRKEYLAADEFDRDLVAKASSELAGRENAFPKVGIEPGYNTNQALNYNYRNWHEFFNDRQLLCLSILAARISAISDQSLRELFTCLFSGALEFNNMFASYKGEGTGAVRHMFSHHILKPERTPLEANLWGTSKSSGSFSTMFETRILRALEYAENPFELKLSGEGRSATQKVYGISEAIGSPIADSYSDFTKGMPIYVSCGDSSRTDLESGSVDAVLTDPPFFDNVNYSQLADFFHVWQRHILGEGGSRACSTTRASGEVQHGDEETFRDRLGDVWAESCRVLKSDGLLVFSYHHSRTEGWRSVLQALMNAGFGIVAAHPVKAEMSVAMPKQQAKEPIDLDILIVCRKLAVLTLKPISETLWADISAISGAQVERLSASGRSLSRNDVRIIVMSHLLQKLSTTPSISLALQALDASDKEIERVIEVLHDRSNQRKLPSP